MIPVLVLTGPLGAGKTTTLNALLRHRPELRIAVVENEVGDVNVDEALITGARDVLQVTGGCACCTLSGQLHLVLDHLAQRTTEFDAIVIEASGVADPTAIVRALQHHELRPFMRLTGLACVIDPSRLQDLDRLTGRQLRFADTVVLTKASERGSPTASGTVVQHAREDAVIVDATDAPHRLAAHLHAPLLNGSHPAAGVPETPHLQVEDVALNPDGPLEQRRLHRWMMQLLDDPTILRVKGQVRIHGMSAPATVQLTTTQFELSPARNPRPDRLVILGHHLDADALARDLAACGPQRLPPRPS